MDASKRKDCRKGTHMKYENLLEYYYGNALNMFVENVLSFCDQLKNMYTRVGTRSFLLQNMEDTKISLIIDTRNPSINSLLNFLTYNYGKPISIHECEKKTYLDEFSWKYRIDGELNFGIDKIQCDISHQRILKLLEDAIIAEKEEIEEFKKRLTDFFDTEKKILNSAVSGKKYFPAIEDIEACLDNYFQMLRFILLQDRFMEIPGFTEKVLKAILFIGNYQEGNTYKTTLYFPGVMADLPVIYANISHYLSISVETDAAQKCYHSIFLAKLHQAYRLYSVVPQKNDLWHIALPAYTTNRSTDMCLALRKIQDYDSYEGVGELRLVDKILYELQYRKERGLRIDNIKIAIIGEIDYYPMINMCDYLKKAIRIKYPKWKNEYKISFWIYSKKCSEKTHKDLKTDEKFILKFYQESDAYFEHLERLTRLLNRMDMFFLLDNYKLYNRVFVKSNSDDKIFLDTLEKRINYKEENHNDFRMNKKLNRLYYMGVSQCYANSIGSLEKTAHMNLIHTLENIVNNSEEEKIVYVYISDIKAFSEMYCNKKQYVRVEKYRDKQIGIIRFANRSERQLSVQKEKQKIIVFNMWQFVKHIAIVQKNYFEDEIIRKNYKGKILLEQILIGIEYTEWLSELRFSYMLDSRSNIHKALDCEKLESIIEDVIIRSFLLQNKKNVYQKYFREAFISMLYGDAKSVEDLLFLHIYKWHGHEIKKARFDEDRINLSLGRYKNLDYRFSTKRFYQAAMEELDVTFHSQYEEVKAYISLYRDLERDLLPDTGEGSTKDLIQNIKCACEELTYDNSPLYKHCIDYILRY